MSLKEISKQQTLAVQAERQQALDDVKRPLAEPAGFARKELPNIEAALAEADAYRREHVDSIDWKAIGGMPREIPKILVDLEGLRNNVGNLREHLKRCDAFTWKDCWGNRADGQRDINKAANVRGDFNFNIARGCARAIQGCISRIKWEIAQEEERKAFNGQMLSAEARPIRIPLPEGSGEVKVISNLPHD